MNDPFIVPGWSIAVLAISTIVFLTIAFFVRPRKLRLNPYHLFLTLGTMAFAATFMLGSVWYGQTH